MKTMRKRNDEIYQLAKDQALVKKLKNKRQSFNRRMNGHRRNLTKKTLLPVSQHFVSPGHSLEDFCRSKIYIIDHNPSWKENQRQKKESFWRL
jgi:hypothetical protein